MPVCASHKPTVSFSIALASVFPSGLNATLMTSLVYPVRVLRHSPVSRSHKRRVPSRPPLVSVFPSGLNATLKTRSLCPVRIRWRFPVCTSHRRTVPLSIALANVFPSGLNAMSSTPSPFFSFECFLEVHQSVRPTDRWEYPNPNPNLRVFFHPD